MAIPLHPRHPGVILLLLALLPLGTYVAELARIAGRTGEPETVQHERCAHRLLEAQQGFTALENTLWEAARSAAADTGVASYLNGEQPDRSPLFARLALLAGDEETGLEVYDRYGVCQAWTGRSGPEHRREVERALGGTAGVGVERTPLFAELFCVLPVPAGTSTGGVILARRILGLNYPFTNRILTRTGLAEQLSARVGTEVEFRFAGDQEPWSPGLRSTSPLYARDSTVVGQIGVACPEGDSIAEEIRESFKPYHAAALLPLLVAGVLFLWRIARRAGAPWLQALLLTAVIWGTRMLVLVLDVAEALLPMWMNDRSLYAAGGVYGLLASPAELFLTSLAVFASALVLSRWLRTGSRQSGPWSSLLPRGAVLLVLLAALPPLLGLAARTIVQDSTANFGDPVLLVPGPGFFLLIISGTLLMLSALLAAAGTLAGVFSSISPPAGSSSTAQSATAGAWIAVALLTAAIAEGVSAGLVPDLSPSGAASVLFLSSAVLGYGWWRSGAGGTARTPFLLAAVLISGILLHLYAAPEARQKDRRRIEALAMEMLRPVDSWFRGVVEDALRGFSTDQVLQVLDQGDHEETRRLAFTVWAHSIACREGYATDFAVTDAGGQTISRFAIGGQSFRIPEELPDVTEEGVTVRDVGSGVGAVRIYAGDVPLRDASGATLGYGRVQVAAARQTLFRGETPAILRSTSHAGFESFHREVALAEYRDGALVPSEGVTLPLGSILPPSIRDRLESAPQHGLWVHERQEGRHLETYYMRGDEERTRVVALSMERPGLQWHVAGLLRILAACSLLLLTGAAIALTRFLAGGGRPIFRFRHRLLGAFLLLSVLPMTGVLLYVQWFAGERLIERTSRELAEETRDIVGRVTPVLGTSFDRRPSVDREVEGIAVDRNTDFNLYLGEELLSSSAPTLYEAGILDRRLNAEAYRTVVLDRHPFVMQRERVGEYRFAVGYRALMDSVGTVLAVIAVPTVFRQEDLDREIAGTTTFVAALGIVVLLFVVLAAAAIAHTIAAPIQDLTEATARVTRGDLDAVVKQGHAGGELGVLVRAFERMTHDLKSSRDALIRYERELAWKEMAKQVAHEINNPLTPMKLLLQHLGKAYRDGAEDFGELLDRVLRTVIGQIDQLGRIAAEFSHFARMPKRIVEPSSLRQIINEVVDLYSKEPKVRFSITAPVSLPSVRVDRDELRRAFINVIRNGVQAMSGEGVIEIRAALSGAGIAVEIRDHGPGMPEEVRLRAFDAGFTTKKGGSGVGLGLVRSTMEELGGTVTLASTPGEGTTVTLWIPLGPVETDGGTA